MPLKVLILMKNLIYNPRFLILLPPLLHCDISLHMSHHKSRRISEYKIYIMYVILTIYGYFGPALESVGL